MPELSIVIPTCNRAALLAECLYALRQDCCGDDQIIVVDGASTDHTPRVLAEFAAVPGPQLAVIREDRREGFVRAANKGFRAAAGRYLMWLNDDARVVAGSLHRALGQMRLAPPGVGLLALFHHTTATRSIAYSTTCMGRPFALMHVRGTLYANFGLGPRQLFQQLGYFDDGFFLNGADPDFSLKVWHSGLRVEPALGALIDHDEHDDHRREADAGRAADDNCRLFDKWDLPQKNPSINDFDPIRPCTLRGLRPPAAAA